MKSHVRIVALAGLGLLLSFMPAAGAGVLKASLAVNGVWFDGPNTEMPRNLEAGGSLAASLSRHIDLNGQLFAGIGEENYWRWTVGPFIGLSAPDANFSLSAGVAYHGSNEDKLKPNEWSPGAKLGWKPWPDPGDPLRKITIGVHGWYGLKSDRAGALLALRYNAWKQGGR